MRASTNDNQDSYMTKQPRSGLCCGSWWAVGQFLQQVSPSRFITRANYYILHFATDPVLRFLSSRGTLLKFVTLFESTYYSVLSLSLGPQAYGSFGQTQSIHQESDGHLAGYLKCSSITGCTILVRTLAFQISRWDRGKEESLVCKVLALEGSFAWGWQGGWLGLDRRYDNALSFQESRIRTMNTLKLTEPTRGQGNLRIATV